MPPTNPTRTPTGPNTSHKATYRRDVWCHNCHAPRWFVCDTGHWVCCECRYVELTCAGELAPSPWVENHNWVLTRGA